MYAIMGRPYRMYVVGWTALKTVIECLPLNIDGCAIGGILKKVVPDNLCLQLCVFHVVDDGCQQGAYLVRRVVENPQ